MKALRFHGRGDLRLEDIVEPEPAAGEVRIRVDACGVCGSDLHFLDGSARTGVTPVTLGHEIAGTVLESRHEAWSEGTEVVVAAGVPCDDCPRCYDGRANLCEHMKMTGIDFDGGWAEMMVAPARALVHRPASLDPDVAAIAGDAGATALHAIARRAALEPDQTIAVIGVGGLGTFGVQIAKRMGAAAVIAVDRSEAALRRAKAMGADETVLVEAETSVGRAVKMLTDGGVDRAVEFVGRAETVDAAVKCLRPGGIAVAVGVGNEALATLPPVLWAMNEYELRGSFGSLDGDVTQVLDWLVDGTLSPPPLTDHPLTDAHGPISRAAETGQSDGRLVVLPG